MTTADGALTPLLQRRDLRTTLNCAPSWSLLAMPSQQRDTEVLRLPIANGVRLVCNVSTACGHSPFGMPNDGSCSVAVTALVWKPFYYVKTPTLFAFASEPKALGWWPSYPRRWTRSSSKTSWPATRPAGSMAPCSPAFGNCPGGHSLSISEGAFVIKRYWSLPVNPDIGPAQPDDGPGAARVGVADRRGAPALAQ